jgi:hypothetical protein
MPRNRLANCLEIHIINNELNNFLYCPTFDEGLVPDLPRGRGRLIGGDLDVGEESFEQMIITLQLLHHTSVGYQHARTRVGLTKKAKFLQMQPRTQATIRKNVIGLQMNV